MARTRRVSDRLRELKQIEKRIQRELINEIARTAVRSYNPETKTIDTRELIELIGENWDFLSKKYKDRAKRSEVEHENED